MGMEAWKWTKDSQGYYLGKWLVCVLNQAKFDTYVSDIYSFAYFTFQLTTWLSDLPNFEVLKDFL